MASTSYIGVAVTPQNTSAQQFMDPQNAARALVGLPPLVWDAKLEKYAAWYANHRHGDCALEHSNGPYGENIFWGSGDGWTPDQAAEAWVSEKSGYDYRSMKLMNRGTPPSRAATSLPPPLAASSPRSRGPCSTPPNAELWPPETVPVPWMIGRQLRRPPARVAATPSPYPLELASPRATSEGRYDGQEPHP
ncbi:hypothetical protein F511_20088 [Dorcoceras hygrometricum]|uniref:SCP domain-containing protein n=1 Tax=Dorcoceras hygrometricum TaxID=472368 RepID=A0A2Z7BNZ6_9LAMI|nr:hypothetical protein F511_20088 [Dorcoceras hygrometricum]